MHSSYVLPRCQTSRYTLKRPQSATVRPLVGHNRFLAAVASSPESSGRLARPLSALQNSFVTWNQQPFDDLVDGEDDDTVEYEIERPKSAAVAQRSPPSNAIRPAHALQHVQQGDAARSLPHDVSRGDDAWDNTSFGVDRAPALEPSAIPQQETSAPTAAVSVIAAVERLGRQEEQPAVAAESPVAVVGADITSPSRKVTGLRDATSQARRDQDTQGPVKQDDVMPPKAPTATESVPFVSHVNVSDDAPPNIFAMDIRSTFADFIERDKYFEGVCKVLFDQEFRERLEHSMLQTARCNGLYVAMTRVYLRWAETGLNPDDPDPVSHAEMEVLALRQLQHRRNIDNIVLIEERDRRLLTCALLEALESDYGCVYVAMEEEAVRRHIANVYEPERWACVTQHIATFLSTSLVCAAMLFKQWSLVGGEIEREESCLRQDIYRSCAVRSRHAKKAKLEVSETSARDVIERDERIKFQALVYAASLSDCSASSVAAAPQQSDIVAAMSNPSTDNVPREEDPANATTDDAAPDATMMGASSAEPTTVLEEHEHPCEVEQQAGEGEQQAGEGEQHPAPAPVAEQHLEVDPAAQPVDTHGHTNEGFSPTAGPTDPPRGDDDDDDGGIMVVPTIAIDGASTTTGSPRNASTSGPNDSVTDAVEDQTVGDAEQQGDATTDALQHAPPGQQTAAPNDAI